MPLTKPFSLPWPLAVGDHSPKWALPSSLGHPLHTDDFAGSPLVLCFLPPRELPTLVTMVTQLRDLYPKFLQLGARIVAVTKVSDESYKQFADQFAIPFPVLADADGIVSRAFGATRRAGLQTWAQTTRTVVLDANHRVARIDDSIDPARHAATLLELVQALAWPEPAGGTGAATGHPPVLVIPRVLPPELCNELMRVWETQGNSDSGFMRQVGDQTVGMIDHRTKIRRDHFLAEGALREHLNHLMFHRVKPEIEKAFHFEATRFEDFRIVCYDATTGGYFRRHRDNTTAGTAHRAFAMTLNLNAQSYSGGYLRFPEYGPQLYRPATGEAVVFSCSLLHEATDVTEGRRYVLLSFFYGEKQAQTRDAYNRRQQAQSA